jgi:hypothetical protein
MKYLITIRTATGARTYHAVGTLGALLDAAYDAGALGITSRVLP